MEALTTVLSAEIPSPAQLAEADAYLADLAKTTHEDLQALRDKRTEETFSRLSGDVDESVKAIDAMNAQERHLLQRQRDLAHMQSTLAAKRAALEAREVQAEHDRRLEIARKLLDQRERKLDEIQRLVDLIAKLHEDACLLDRQAQDISPFTPKRRELIHVAGFSHLDVAFHILCRLEIRLGHPMVVKRADASMIEAFDRNQRPNGLKSVVQPLHAVILGEGPHDDQENILPEAA